MVGGTAEGVVATRREERGERLQNRDRAPMLINNDDGTTTSCLHVKEQCSCTLELHRLRCPVETAATNNIIVDGRALAWSFYQERWDCRCDSADGQKCIGDD